MPCKVRNEYWGCYVPVFKMVTLSRVTRNATCNETGNIVKWEQN